MSPRSTCGSLTHSLHSLTHPPVISLLSSPSLAPPPPPSSHSFPAHPSKHDATLHRPITSFRQLICLLSPLDELRIDLPPSISVALFFLVRCPSSTVAWDPSPLLHRVTGHLHHAPSPPLTVRAIRSSHLTIPLYHSLYSRRLVDRWVQLVQEFVDLHAHKFNSLDVSDSHSRLEFTKLHEE